MSNETETLHGTATRAMDFGSIQPGEPVRVTAHRGLPGKYRVKAAGNRSANYLTWEQVMERVRPA